MPEGPPQQERAWNAYGHAMGAAIGLELVLRIANITARFNRIQNSQGSAANIQAQHAKVLRNAGEGTFGHIAKQFCELYPHILHAEPVLHEAMENAVATRNHLAHNFLAGRVRMLRSERG
jgi:hypothetical protein